MVGISRVKRTESQSVPPSRRSEYAFVMVDPSCQSHLWIMAKGRLAGFQLPTANFHECTTDRLQQQWLIWPQRTCTGQLRVQLDSHMCHSSTACGTGIINLPVHAG